jgi:class 3 adenylate cyclase/TolB-like protein
MSEIVSASSRYTHGRLAAVWFADIVGYTRLAAEDNDRALEIVAAFQDLSRAEIADHGGRLVKFIGDAALAEFPSTSAAVHAAADLQRSFVERSTELGRRSNLRIGVHLGEIEAADDGDIYGDGVNTASRLQSEAEPGHVLVSEDVWRSLRSHPEFAFAAAGRRRLRGTSSMTVFEALPGRDRSDAGTRRLTDVDLSWLRGWRLSTILILYAAVGWLLLYGVEALVLRGVLAGVAYEATRIWYLGAFPLLLLVAWFHGYRRHRRAPTAEKILAGGFVLVLLALTTAAVSRHSATARARALAAAGDLDPRHIAVLYFTNVREDTANAYLADGLTEALIDELSGVRALDVISPNGVRQFRDRPVPPDSIARLLNVGTIVDGSIVQRGDMMRLSLLLVDGGSGANIDRAGFEFPVGDLLSGRSEMVATVAGFLRERLGEEVRLQRGRSGTENAAAWALVQHAARARRIAQAALDEGDGAAALAGFQSADSLLAQAAVLDPQWPEPVVLRGRIAYDISRESLDAREASEWNAQARMHAVAALDRDRNDPAALELRGTIDYWQYLLNVEPDEQAHQRLLVSARSDLEAAVRVDPSLASAHSTLSHLYYNYDLAAVVLAARRAYEEDAYLSHAEAIVWRLFNASLDLGQFTQAERWCSEGRRRFPHNYQFAMCQLMLMVTPAVAPDVDVAWRLAARVDSIAGHEGRTDAGIQSELSVGGVLARAGMVDSARSVLLRARQRATPASDPHQELLAYEAYMRTLTGEEDEARRLLTRYAAANPGHLAASAGSDAAWWWRSLQTRPWFQELTTH